MVAAVPGQQGGEDRPGPGGVRLLHPHRLEPALQGWVFLHQGPVLLSGGGPDHADLPPGQGGLEKVGPVDGALGPAGPQEDVELVQEEDDVSRPADLPEELLHPVLELPPVLGPGDDGAQVQLEQALVPEGFGDLPLGHPQGQALRHGGLSHPGVPQEDGVVLGSAEKDADHPVQLRLPATDRVVGAPGGLQAHVTGVLLQDAGGLDIAGFPPAPGGGGPGGGPERIGCVQSFDGDPSFPGTEAGVEAGMTEVMRFSWLAERGAPSSPGVWLPARGGRGGEFAVSFMSGILPVQDLWRKSIKIMPEIYQNNQKNSVKL